MAAPGEGGGEVSPEITRLSAQLAKDPSSRLFMPLAEEYLKAGMAEEAVSALEAGLKANPYYMSAKVLLGKAYLEKGDNERAKEQFEAVIKTIPDNLFAHRKLGEIYLGMGMRAEAASSFKIITLLNPKDEQAKALLEEAESPQAAGADESPETGAGDSEPEPQEFTAFDISEVGPPPEEEPDEAYPLPVDRFASADGVPEPEPEFPRAAIDEPSPEPEPLPDMVAEDFTGEIIPDDFMEADEPVKGYAVDDSARTALEDIFAAYQAPAEGERREEPAEVYEITDDIPSFETDGVKIPPSARQQAPPPPKEVFETETLAELYITQGFYDRAIGIYKNLIIESPGDMRLRQKLEDLYLLANIGKGNKQEAEEIPEASFEDDTLSVWEEETPQSDPMNSWEFFSEPGKRPDETTAGPRVVEPVNQVNMETVKRLEIFLEKIRRKAVK